MEISQNTKNYCKTQQFYSWVYISKQQQQQNNKTQNTNSKRYMFPNVHSSIMYNH